MPDLSFSYTVVRSRRKSVAIRIRPDGAVEVRCPLFASEERLREIVCRKADRIEKKLLEIKSAPPVVPFTEDELRALTHQARESLPPLIAYYAARVGVSCGRVTIRHQKSRWGSCSAKGNLNFNCLLMLTPPEVIDYVIVHELCHLKQMNHSFKFWAKVESVIPNYREAQKWLKENGESLIRRLPA